MIFCHMTVKHSLRLQMEMRNARFLHAGVAELADAQDLGAREKKLDGGCLAFPPSTETLAG
jgi:hypothetical protein